MHEYSYQVIVLVTESNEEKMSLASYSLEILKRREAGFLQVTVIDECVQNGVVESKRKRFAARAFHAQSSTTERTKVKLLTGSTENDIYYIQNEERFKNGLFVIDVELLE